MAFIKQQRAAAFADQQRIANEKRQEKESQEQGFDVKEIQEAAMWEEAEKLRFGIDDMAKVGGCVHP